VDHSSGATGTTKRWRYSYLILKRVIEQRVMPYNDFVSLEVRLSEGSWRSKMRVEG